MRNYTLGLVYRQATGFGRYFLFLIRKRLIAFAGATLRGSRWVVLRDLHRIPGTPLFTLSASRARKVPITSSVGATRRSVRLSSPELHVIEASGVVFEPHSELLAQNGVLYRQRPFRGRLCSRGRETFANGSALILWNGKRIGLTTGKIREVPQQIESGILLNGQANDNWYHFLINILPRAFIADKLLDIPLDVPFLVSETISGTNLEGMLRLVVGDRRPLRFLPNSLHEVNHAIIIESPVKELYVPKNVLSRPPWEKLGDFHFEIMTEFRRHLLAVAVSRTDPQAVLKSPRVLLMRDNERRRYNQSEVKKALARLGFIGVRLERLSPHEQIVLMANVDVVVGPTGAQWAGWLFTQGAVGIVLKPRFLKSSSLFSKLGFLGDSSLYEFLVDSGQVSWADFYAGSDASTAVDTARLMTTVMQVLEERTPNPS